jgi:hypothetical protein
VDGLNWITGQVTNIKGVKIVARGDSNLVTQFMQGRAKPGQAQLVISVKEAKATGKTVKRVWYQHVPRDSNQWADWLTRVATVRQSDGSIKNTEKVTDDPPKDVNVDFVGLGGEHTSESNCTKCG